jgi:peptide chain release factor 1
MNEHTLDDDIVLSSSIWQKIINKNNAIAEMLMNGNHDAQSGPSLRKEQALFVHAIQLKTEIESLRKDIFQIKQEAYSLGDEFITLMKDEIDLLEEEDKIKTNLLNDLLYPTTEEQDRSVFLEIRAGTGGLEASLFAGDLAKMYFLYGQRKAWNVSYSHIAETDVGGFREIILFIEGKDVFKHLQHEAGVHRVQRVPDTETQGRVHTSTATVAVLPEVDAVEVNIDQKDLRIDTYRASGAGGQHVNKTDSAIRITHIPTGTVVSCQEDRSQHKNRAKAMKMLQSRLFALEREKQDSKLSQMRKEMSSSAERADKVRTYNYPQNRVSDHRIGITVNRLDYIMQGELNDIIDPLMREYTVSRKPHVFLEPYL